MYYFSQLSYLAILSALLSSFGSGIFAILFSRAATGFHMQINYTLLYRDDIPDLSAYVYLFSTLFILAVVILLAIGTFANILIARNSGLLQSQASISKRNNIIIRISMFLFTIGIYALLGISSVVLCFATAICIIYAIFILFMYSLCDTLKDRCIDLSELLPAFADKFTKSSPTRFLPPPPPSIRFPPFASSSAAVDESICDARRAALCTDEHNVALLFLIAVLFCFVSLIGLVHFLMCITSSYYNNQAKDRQITNDRQWHEQQQRLMTVVDISGTAKD